MHAAACISHEIPAFRSLQKINNLQIGKKYNIAPEQVIFSFPVFISYFVVIHFALEHHTSKQVAKLSQRGRAMLRASL